jgi:hypothetical protein
MNKTLGMGLTFGAGDNELRVAVSVKFQKYPFHYTRKVSITVGELCVYDRMWDAAGKEGALEALQAIGPEVSELVAALEQVDCPS